MKELKFWEMFSWTTFVVWLVVWLSAIWITQYRFELFWTGLFMILCNYGGNVEIKQLKKKSKSNK